MDKIIHFIQENNVIYIVLLVLIVYITALSPTMGVICAIILMVYYNQNTYIFEPKKLYKQIERSIQKLEDDTRNMLKKEIHDKREPDKITIEKNIRPIDSNSIKITTEYNIEPDDPVAYDSSKVDTSTTSTM
jgi:ABC-type siderophore export system fused ATPase/permease subunit|tara:strand:- start:5869 stop:6264 length:396 start_codon:yes stop_codon:yes gene_type:complete